MILILKGLYLYILFVIYKIKYFRKIKFNGFSIIYAHKGSKIIFSEKGGIIINSSIFSNLVGLCQTTIISCRDGGIISIGKNVGISGSTIYAMSSIKLGDNVIIGSGVKIIDNDFHSLIPEKRKNQKDSDICRIPIEIGDDCFIGMNSIILKGTKLGKRCVVGAGSVVHGTFPDNVIIAGNPAQIIKMIDNE